MENRGKRQAASIFGGMGFYIALLVCVVAAGVVGYVALLRDSSVVEVPGDAADPAQAMMDQAESEEPLAVSAPEEDDTPQPVLGQEALAVPLPTQQTDAADGETAAAAAQEETPALPADADAQLPEELASGLRSVVSPVVGEAVAVFAMDRLVYDETLGDWRTHDGIDLQAEAGSAVSAAAAGTVLSVTDDDRMGVMVTIQHENGYVTTYASLHPEVSVAAGDSVSAGTVIGTVGTTALAELSLGEHVHFAVTKDGETVDPAQLLG